MSHFLKKFNDKNQVSQMISNISNLDRKKHKKISEESEWRFRRRFFKKITFDLIYSLKDISFTAKRC